MILTETQQAIADAIRDFAQERIRPNTLKFEADGGYPAGLFEEMAGLGLMGMTAPEEFGGAATDYVSYALALMEIAAADGALSTIVSIQNSILVSGLLKDGTPGAAKTLSARPHQRPHDRRLRADRNRRRLRCLRDSHARHQG